MLTTHCPKCKAPVTLKGRGECEYVPPDSEAALQNARMMAIQECLAIVERYHSKENVKRNLTNLLNGNPAPPPDAEQPSETDRPFAVARTDKPCPNCLGKNWKPEPASGTAGLRCQDCKKWFFADESPDPATTDTVVDGQLPGATLNPQQEAFLLGAEGGFNVADQIAQWLLGMDSENADKCIKRVRDRVREEVAQGKPLEEIVFLDSVPENAKYSATK